MNRGVWPTFSRFWIILEKNRGRKIVHFVEILGNEIHTFEEYILLFKFILFEKNVLLCTIYIPLQTILLYSVCLPVVLKLTDIYHLENRRKHQNTDI